MDQQECRRPAQDQVVAAGIFVPQVFEAGKIGVHLGEGHAEQGPENRVFELAHHRGERIDRETADPLERLGRGDQRESHLLLVAGRRSPMSCFHDPLQHFAGYRFAGEGAVRAPCPAEQHHLFGRRQVVSVEGMHPFGREAVVQDGARGTGGDALAAYDAAFGVVYPDGAVLGRAGEELCGTDPHAAFAADAGGGVDSDVCGHRLQVLSCPLRNKTGAGI